MVAATLRTKPKKPIINYRAALLRDASFPLAMKLPVVLVCVLVPVLACAEPPVPDALGVFGTSNVPAEIVGLLQKNSETYGPDAVLLQIQLLHHAIQAGSILSAGVQIHGIEPHRAQRYLLYRVDTGIVFNTQRTNRRQRVDRVWSGIVLPALARLDTYKIPADGIAFDLAYHHRLYRDMGELENTVHQDPGQGERAAFYLLRLDLLAFGRHEIDASALLARSKTRVDGALLGKALEPDQ
jgi:hypothetical protein